MEVSKWNNLNRFTRETIKLCSLSVDESLLVNFRFKFLKRLLIFLRGGISYFSSFMISIHMTLKDENLAGAITSSEVYMHVYVFDQSSVIAMW